MEPQDPVRIVVAGGGFGGLEAALYLRQRLGEEAAITLVSDQTHFLFRPYLTYVPFGLEPEDVRIDLRSTARSHGIAFRKGRAGGLDPAARRLDVDDKALAFDYLIVATGAKAGPQKIPGLADRAFTIWNSDDMERLRDAFQRLLRATHAGHRQRVVFLVPPGCDWAGPLYEMAFMLATWLQAHDARGAVDLVLATWDSTHLSVLGPDVHTAITRELDERGIETHTSWVARRIENETVESTEDALSFDLLVTTPTYTAAADWAPLPVDEQGFLQVAHASRLVDGHSHVYAVGDASDFPVKQAFLALLQADAAAEHLAARVRNAEPAFSFDAHSLWVMDQLDQALFTRVPLNQDGAAAEINRMPAGEMQRMLLSARLPRLFGENPLYAGLVWKGTRVGLKILKHLTDT